MDDGAKRFGFSIFQPNPRRVKTTNHNSLVGPSSTLYYKPIQSSIRTTMFPAVRLSQRATVRSSRSTAWRLVRNERRHTTAAAAVMDVPRQFGSSSSSHGHAMMVVGGLVLAAGAFGSTHATTTTTKADVVGVGAGTPIQEPVTGILFPKLVNGFYFAGCGVRIKYVFVKVYAVASYFDPLAMSAVQHNPLLLQEALLNPTYPRTIVIIMNRNLSADKMTSALVEALEPRMAGQDLDKLEEFKKMNPAVDLVKGTYVILAPLVNFKTSARIFQLTLSRHSFSSLFFLRTTPSSPMFCRRNRTIQEPRLK
jgi:hypothetical protein